MLVSQSPILTKTCWNRRFGGDVQLCSSATKLLMEAGLLQEGNFAATASSTFISWIKKLPSDPTNVADTLAFQQTKLNMFNVTWQEYALSFKDSAFNHGTKASMISKVAAEILRSKPYTDVGFKLNESNVVTRSSSYIAEYLVPN